MRPAELLHRWLARQLPADTMDWLGGAVARVRASAKDVDLYLAVSLAPRKVGKADLELNEADMDAARAARAGWDPRGWSVDQAVRLYLLLALESDSARFARSLDNLCATADVAELAAFYRGLPLYPDPPRYLARATEGLRTNIKSVFESIALRNPFPAEQFPEGPWNQMVLKALFVGSALAPIVGLDRRANPALAHMLCDYAHERWSAARPVSPELWRCVGPHARGDMLRDLDKVLQQGTPPERQAAALALHAAPDGAGVILLQQHPDLADAIAGGRLTWNALAIGA